MLLTIVVIASLSNALVFQNPHPTSFAEDSWSPQGWTPKPTPGPVPRFQLNRGQDRPLKRQVSTQVCGYVNGNADWEYGCDDDNFCAYFTSGSMGLWGCSRSSTTVSQWPRSCWDYEYSASCSPDCLGVFATLCSADSPYCTVAELYSEFSIPLVTLGCGAARESYLVLPYATYTSYADFPTPDQSTWDGMSDYINPVLYAGYYTETEYWYSSSVYTSTIQQESGTTSGVVEVVYPYAGYVTETIVTGIVVSPSTSILDQPSGTISGTVEVFVPYGGYVTSTLISGSHTAVYTTTVDVAFGASSGTVEIVFPVAGYRTTTLTSGSLYSTITVTTAVGTDSGFIEVIVPTSSAMVPSTSIASTSTSSIIPVILVSPTTYIQSPSSTPTPTTTSTPPSTTSTTTLPATTNADTTPTSSPLPTPSPGLSGGAKAGIAVGVILGVAILAALAYYLFRRRRRQPEGNDQRESYQSYDTGPIYSDVSSPQPVTSPVVEKGAPAGDIHQGD